MRVQSQQSAVQWYPLLLDFAHQCISLSFSHELRSTRVYCLCNPLRRRPPRLSLVVPRSILTATTSARLSTLDKGCFTHILGERRIYETVRCMYSEPKYCLLYWGKTNVAVLCGHTAESMVFLLSTKMRLPTELIAKVFRTPIRVPPPKCT